jgi:hypothetical protein
MSAFQVIFFLKRDMFLSNYENYTQLTVDFLIFND